MMTEIGGLERSLASLAQVGLRPLDLLLPGPGIDMTKWAVNSPDQYKLQPKYWEDVEKFVGEEPSALHSIFPEAFIGLRDPEEAKRNIWDTQRRYIKDGTLQSQGKCFVLVDRTLPSGKSRKGLVVALDPEKYGPSGLIRPTEAIIPDRLELREEIRTGLLVNYSHSIFIYDDPCDTVIGSLLEDGIGEELYNFELMMRAGKVKGYKINNPLTMGRIAENIGNIFYNGFWSLHGDGHHEFSSGDYVGELVNLHSEGLEIYPIHREVSNINPEEVLRQMKSFYEGKGFTFNSETYSTEEDMQIRLKDLRKENRHLIGYVTQYEYGIIIIENPESDLEIKTLQSFLDVYKSHNENAVIEYPHEEGEVALEGLKPNNIGFYLSAIPKKVFFKVFGQKGPLDPKLFSIGGPDDKRFLLEGNVREPSSASYLH